MPSLSVLLPWLYYALPFVATAVMAFRARRRRSFEPIRELLVTFFAGAVGGLALVLLYQRGFHARVPASQFAIACYWGMAVACLLRGLNSILSWTLTRAVSGGDISRRCSPPAEVTALILRAGLLLAFAIPYLGAMILTYRPRAVSPGTPASLLGAEYQNVTFTASDGIRLRGWWIPAARSEGTEDAHNTVAWGSRTVILCHGFGADKASQLRLARDLSPNGYNVLAFDFRAHGQSDGQFTTFGDLERNDVLAAVRWTRANHPNESRKLFGLGESLGAAALISAAADATPDGQAIDAVAVFTPYDRLSTLVQDMADRHYSTTTGWVINRLILPLAGMQLGTTLQNFAPEDDVRKLAPRPLLIIAAEEDRDADIYGSKRVYDEASQPKYGYWIKKRGRDAMLFSDDNAMLAIRVFFETARNVL